MKEFDDNHAKASIDNLWEIITAVRNERSKANKAPKDPISITLFAKDSNTLNIFNETKKYIEKFTNPKELVFTDKDINPKGNVIVVLHSSNIYIPEDDLVDRVEVIKSLNLKKQKLEAELERSKKMLSNESFVSKAPKEKIENEKMKQEAYLKQYQDVLNALKELNQ